MRNFFCSPTPSIMLSLFLTTLLTAFSNADSQIWEPSTTSSTRPLTTTISILARPSEADWSNLAASIISINPTSTTLELACRPSWAIGKKDPDQQGTTTLSGTADISGEMGPCTESSGTLTVGPTAFTYTNPGVGSAQCEQPKPGRSFTCEGSTEGGSVVVGTIEPGALENKGRLLVTAGVEKMISAGITAQAMPSKDEAGMNGGTGWVEGLVIGILGLFL